VRADLIDYLRRRLREPLPGHDAQLRMAPNPRHLPDPALVWRPAAALLLLYPQDGEWWLPLTVRGAGLRHHGGQVSLPGGRLDRPDESIVAAALREANEEVGIAAADVEVLGELTPLAIPVSGFVLHPVVGALADRPTFVPAAAEVDRLIEVPIARLLQPDAVAWEQRVMAQAPDVTIEVPYFALDGARVWGATAMVLAELIAVLAERSHHAGSKG
jgi:8-oxo-dGTP pyrophosphatase MutT (NUDIX family)